MAVDIEEPGLIGDGDVISLVKGMTSEARSGLGVDTYRPSEEELKRRGPLLDRLPWSRCCSRMVRRPPRGRLLPEKLLLRGVSADPAKKSSSESKDAMMKNYL